MDDAKKISAWGYIKNDLETYYQKNGCRNFIDFIAIFLFYPQLWAIIIYRIGHGIKNKLLYKLYVYLLWNPIRLMTAMEIWPQATIGRNFHIIHFGNIIINPKVVIGDNCILQGECAIGVGFEGGQAPVLEDNVKIGIGSKIIGDLRIGRNSMIGANAFVTTSIPENVIVVGNPARVVRKIEP
jgi:serine O-acetyltransferase